MFVLVLGKYTIQRREEAAPYKEGRDRKKEKKRER